MVVERRGGVCGEEDNKGGETRAQQIKSDKNSAHPRGEEAPSLKLKAGKLAEENATCEKRTGILFVFCLVFVLHVVAKERVAFVFVFGLFCVCV